MPAHRDSIQKDVLDNISLHTVSTRSRPRALLLRAHQICVLAERAEGNTVPSATRHALGEDIRRVTLDRETVIAASHVPIAQRYVTGA